MYVKSLRVYSGHKPPIIFTHIHAEYEENNVIIVYMRNRITKLTSYVLYT